MLTNWHVLSVLYYFVKYVDFVGQATHFFLFFHFLFSKRPVTALNNGDRKGVTWSAGGGWNDATSGVYPDWVQITFNGQKSINEVDVFTLQDNYPAPVEPTLALTFSKYGVTSFVVQYWDGAA